MFSCLSCICRLPLTIDIATFDQVNIQAAAIDFNIQVADLTMVYSKSQKCVGYKEQKLTMYIYYFEMAVKQQTRYFWLVFKILNLCEKLILMQGSLYNRKTHAIVMVVSVINNSFKRN